MHIFDTPVESIPAIALPFTRAALVQVLTWGAHPDASPYSHGQIAHWCERFWNAFSDVDAGPDIDALMPVLADVETQWDLYLANSYPAGEIRTGRFDAQRMPAQWFAAWLGEIGA